MAREGRVAVVACGALATDLGVIVGRRGWPVDVHPLPPLLHNHPERIAGQVAELADSLADYFVYMGGEHEYTDKPHVHINE